MPPTRKPRRYKTRPISLTVSRVTSMSAVQHFTGEVSGSVNIKMHRQAAADLFKLLNDELAKSSHGFITFTLEGLVK